MIWEPRHAVAKARVAFLAALLSSACTGSLPQPTTNFSGPSGMALAGTAWNYIYIANSSIDALQVVRLNTTVKSTDMVPAPARYYPLYIPAGPNVSAVAASYDGAYVFVLDSVTSTVGLVDADAQLLVRDPNGIPLLAPISIPDAGPSDMVAAAVACTSALPDTQCLGRAYVTLRGVGIVASIDLLQQGSAPVSLRVQALPVGGAPARLAVHPTLDIVYITDADNPELIVVDQTQGTPQIRRLPIGYAGGPVGVAADGTMVVVGRALPRDVIILDTASLQPVDANPTWTPVALCVQGCGDPNADICQAAHPADQAVCTIDNGLAAGPAPAYQALFLGLVPAQIAPIASPAFPMTIPCQSGDKVFNQAVAVATVDGAIYSIGLRDAADLPHIELASSDNCTPPSLTFTPTKVSPNSYLAPCPAVPAARQRFACIAANSDALPAAGVIALPGQANGQSWQLVWEAVLPQMDRSAGGGSIDADGNFNDGTAPLPYNPALIVPRMVDAASGEVTFNGDILEITTSPLATPACQDATVCLRERYITAVQGGVGAPLTLTLDEPLPAACYAPGDVLGYRIRAGQNFLVTPSNTGSPTRLAPGAAFGIGQYGGAAASVLFALQDLPQDLTTRGCFLYAKDGSVVPGSIQSPILARNAAYWFQINDSYAPARKGLAFDATNNLVGTVGQLPGGMVLTRLVNGLQPLLFVTYVGSDAVFISNPQNTSTVNIDDLTNKILR